MIEKPTEEEPGFEAEVDELPEDDQGSPNTLEEEPKPEDDLPEMQEAQEQAAEERKEGGYQ
ncbi:hypothetical protein ASG29_16020 [Sphingomonas sp. Leaf412]|uniref:hypothetical protein n=1 Tax=Sphingomonas sp. Leaf412 TaxID=1736370 RepID=UPI0006F42287|nr:hypothetical protein [Sphingomonas sp. Leaf412]KQT31010.1 hypothetical protein ASG29_16020 [Sphingomonas sp. Leaf412]